MTDSQTDSQASGHAAIERLRGRLGRDELSGREGELMDVINGYAFLRPPSGGLEWETPLARVTLLPVGDNEGEGDSDNAPRPA